MNLILTRTDFRDDGIYGEITDEAGKHICVSLEHAYDSGAGDGSYAPKVPPGTYLCQQGEHQLAHMSYPFVTFEVTGVPNHKNILFHVGNYNDDSEGCVLVGTAVRPVGDGTWMISASKNAFNAFMQLQDGTNQFTLTVRNGKS